MSVKSLIASAINGNAAEFKTSFDTIMQEKMGVAVQSKFSPSVQESKCEDDEDETDEDEADEEDDEVVEVKTSKAKK